jgi:hypothetical protein
LDEGYTNLSVLDISDKSLNRAKARLGQKADLVKWIVSDISEFKPESKYDLWHDRAAFHFLTSDDKINKYAALAANAILPEGWLIMGTFSENGPKKCSGLEVRQYGESSMNHVFQASFECEKCITADHPTPFNTTQNFLFCSFKKNKISNFLHS